MKPDLRYVHFGNSCGTTISRLTLEGNADYGRAHRTIRFYRGGAWQYSCCGCRIKKARHWARIHEACGRDPWDYVPLCISCHAIYDGKGKDVVVEQDEKGRFLKGRTRRR